MPKDCRDRRKYQKAYRKLNKRKLSLKKKIRYRQNPNKVIKLVDRYYRRNKKKILTYKQRYYRKNRKRILGLNRKRQTKRKKAVLRIYGGKCRYCKTKELAILSIDHINDDGFKERAKFDKNHSNNYAKLYKRPKRKDLQILCMNCQWRKRVYGPNFSTWRKKQETV